MLSLKMHNYSYQYYGFWHMLAGVTGKVAPLLSCYFRPPLPIILGHCSPPAYYSRANLGYMVHFSKTINNTKEINLNVSTWLMYKVCYC